MKAGCRQRITLAWKRAAERLSRSGQHIADKPTHKITIEFSVENNYTIFH